MSAEELMRKAVDAMARAYAPYSEFKVGAAVLAKSGKIYTGANIENASFGLTICAERVAIYKAVSEGDDLSAIAVASGSGDSRPCGACRQVMMEFNPNMEVHYLAGGKTISCTAADLLPDPFSGAALK